MCLLLGGNMMEVSFASNQWKGKVAQVGTVLGRTLTFMLGPIGTWGKNTYNEYQYSQQALNQSEMLAIKKMAAGPSPAQFLILTLTYTDRLKLTNLWGRFLIPDNDLNNGKTGRQKRGEILSLLARVSEERHTKLSPFDDKDFEQHLRGLLDLGYFSDNNNECLPITGFFSEKMAYAWADWLLEDVYEGEKGTLTSVNIRGFLQRCHPLIAWALVRMLYKKGTISIERSLYTGALTRYQRFRAWVHKSKEGQIISDEDKDRYDYYIFFLHGNALINHVEKDPRKLALHYDAVLRTSWTLFFRYLTWREIGLHLYDKGLFLVSVIMIVILVLAKDSFFAYLEEEAKEYDIDDIQPPFWIHVIQSGKWVYITFFAGLLFSFFFNRIV